MQKYEEICIEINRKERFSKNVMMYNTSPKPQKSLYQSFQRPHKPSCLPRRQRSHTYHPSIPCCAMLCRTVPCLGHRLQEKLLVISHETFVAFLELGRGSHHALRPWSDTMVGHHGLMLPVSLWLLLVLLRDVHLFPLTHVFSCVFF